MTSSTPLPEQGGFNEKLDEILLGALNGYYFKDPDSDILTPVVWDSSPLKEQYKTAIRTLVLEEIIGEDIEVKGIYDYRANLLRAEQRKKLEDTHGTK